MVILFKANKALVITVDTKLYQRENAVDSIIFYSAPKYEDYKLDQFIPTLSYVNSANEAYIETLEWVESDKENFLKLRLPVTTKLTQFAGDITMHLTFTWQDLTTGQSYILKSTDLTITILAWEDYFRFTPSDAFSSIDNKLLQIDTEIQKLKSIEEDLDKDVPNDLMLTGELLQLSKDGTAIGDGVEVSIAPEDVDPVYDGISDLDNVVDYPEVEDYQTSIITL